jgi:CDP-paratose 2-epimerase
MKTKSDNVRSVLVTGSCGLIGSEVVAYFDSRGWRVVGVDNNMRRDFFGEQGDTTWNRRRLLVSCPRYTHHDLDIRERTAVMALLEATRPALVVHAAAQPSHDLAAMRPFDDFSVNALGTLNLLEATRLHQPEAVFVFLSTNKVYGDRPNLIPMIELESRWDYADARYANGIDESMSIDQSKHSLFGVSKTAADLMVQEYGRYYGLSTCCLRGGCLTGPNHSGVQLHGFLSYLIRCNLECREYTIFGYKGKQVRDNIHAFDVARCIEAFFERPGIASVFNLGGGRANSISILEAFDRVSQLTGIPMRYRYVDQPRNGDHICYISDITRLRDALPGWDITKSLDDIFEEIGASWQTKIKELV